MPIHPVSPGSPDYSSHHDQRKAEMKNDIHHKLKDKYGDDATLQSPGDGSAYPPTLMGLIQQFLQTKDWHKSEELYTAIINKIEGVDGDSGGSSQPPPQLPQLPPGFPFDFPSSGS